MKTLEDQRRAVDLATTCSHVLGLDVAWTGNLTADVSQCDREHLNRLAGIGETMAAGLSSVIESLPFFEALSKELEYQMAHVDPELLSAPVGQALPALADNDQSLTGISSMAVGVLRYEGPDEIGGLNDKVVELLKLEPNPSGDLSKRIKAALKIVAGVALLAVAFFSGAVIVQWVAGGYGIDLLREGIPALMSK